ncbi:hypothetical protein ACE1MS_11845 [Lysinibacillus sp. fkY74-1]
MNKTESNNYAVRNSYLAHSLAFITNQKYTVTNDINDANKKVYVFERTDILMEAMTELSNMKKKYSN